MPKYGHLSFPKELFTEEDVRKFRKKELRAEMPWKMKTYKTTYALVLSERKRRR